MPQQLFKVVKKARHMATPKPKVRENENTYSMILNENSMSTLGFSKLS